MAPRNDVVLSFFSNIELGEFIIRFPWHLTEQNEKHEEEEKKCDMENMGSRRRSFPTHCICGKHARLLTLNTATKSWKC